MAQINKSVLGKVSGALGDVVFRERYGKSYVAIRPTSFLPGTDPESVGRRLKFELSIKFSQIINSEQVLKPLWTKVTPAGLSPFNYIMKIDYPYIEVDNVTDLAKIVPDLGFGIRTASVSFTSTEIRLSISPIEQSTRINTDIEKEIQMISVMFFNNPLDESVEGYYLTNLSSPAQLLTVTEPLEFSALLYSEQTVYYDKFQNHKAFIVLVTLDADKKPVNYSTTLVV